MTIELSNTQFTRDFLCIIAIAENYEGIDTYLIFSLTVCVLTFAHKFKWFGFLYRKYINLLLWLLLHIFWKCLDSAFRVCYLSIDVWCRGEKNVNYINLFTILCVWCTQICIFITCKSNRDSGTSVYLKCRTFTELLTVDLWMNLMWFLSHFVFMIEVIFHWGSC